MNPLGKGFESVPVAAFDIQRIPLNGSSEAPNETQTGSRGDFPSALLASTQGTARGMGKGKTQRFHRKIQRL